jgi:hypothetical protein
MYYTVVLNSSWGELHQVAFGNNTGYLICKDTKGLPCVASVHQLQNETIEDTKKRAEIMAQALNKS